MNAQSLSQPRLSLVWKLVLPTVLVVLIGAMIGLRGSWTSLSARSAELASEKLASDERVFFELLDKRRDELAQLGSGLIVNFSQSNQADWVESLNQSPDLFVRLERLGLFNATGEHILSWAPADGVAYEQHEQGRALVAMAAKQLRPQSQVLCSLSCDFLVAAPAASAQGEQFLVLLVAPITDIVLAYKDLTDGDLLLVDDRAKVKTRLLAASLEASGLGSLVSAAVADFDRSAGRTWFHGHWAYRVMEIPGQRGGLVLAVLMRDLRPGWAEGRARAVENLLPQTIMVLVVIGVIMTLLSRSLGRLRRVINLLPQVTGQDHEGTAEALNAAFTGSRWPDEVDALRDNLLRLSARLNTLNGAEAASEAKSRFLATMSHEIRTPMSGIMGLAELLHRGKLDEDQKRMTGMILKSTGDLMTIINDVLDYSKIEAGAMELIEDSFDPLELLTQVAEANGGSARQKKLCLQLLPDQDLPAQIRADRGKLRQVLMNLTANAIKFTAEGRVTLRLSSYCEDEQWVCRFEVEDSGPGVPEAMHESIFERFVQVDASTTREFGGTGLGLPISRGLVELMGGELRVVSAPGQGARFVATVPVEIEQPCKAPAGKLERVQVQFSGIDSEEQACLAALLQVAGARIVGAVDEIPENGVWVRLSRSRAMPCCELALLVDGPNIHESKTVQRPFSPIGVLGLIVQCCNNDDTAEVAKPTSNLASFNKKVLVVEDQQVNRELLCRQLDQLGCRHIAVENGQAALKAMQANKVDLVITDLHMPEMDGYSLTRAIRAGGHANDPGLPIAVLTASASPQDLEKLRSYGVDRKLIKPIRLRDLKEFIAGLQFDESAPAQDIQADHDEKCVDQELLAEVMGDDLAMLGRFVTSYEQTNRPLLSQCREALLKGRADDLRELAHRLKGSSRTLGGMRLANLFAQLEEASSMTPDQSHRCMDKIETEFDVFVAALGHLAAEPAA